MFSFMFPECIKVSCIDSDAINSCALHPEEELLLSPEAVEKRRREFLMGRTAARRGLQQLGILNPPAILRGERREPIWPQGVVGSITHAGDYAVAAVANERDVLAVGIDIEKVKQRQVAEIARTIADDAELQWIKQDSDLLEQRTLLIFSAKESVFKALYPLCKVFLDYSAVSITCVKQGEFFATFSTQTKAIFSSNDSLSNLSGMPISFRTYRLPNEQSYVQTSTYILQGLNA